MNRRQFMLLLGQSFVGCVVITVGCDSPTEIDVIAYANQHANNDASSGWEISGSWVGPSGSDYNGCPSGSSGSYWFV